MKAFRFKLERILALRKHREREWEIRLAGITGECVRLRREIEERDLNRAKALVDSIPGRTGELDVLDLINSQNYINRLEQEVERKGIDLAGCEAKREEVQASFLEVSRDRKVLDKLKEKRSFGYKKSQRIEEIKQIDDINTGRAVRAAKRLSKAVTESNNG